MKLRRVFLISGGGIVLVLLVLALWWVPKKQVASLSKAGVDVKDVFKAENDARATLAQILGGLVVLVGLYFAWSNIVATKEGQITDRFYKAIEQLGAADDKGKPKLELRLGGIYALERIARDSEKDHWPIMEILTAYVRETSHKKKIESQLTPVTAPPLTTDIQAILTVIRRREWSYEKNGQNLDLQGTDLHGAELFRAHLKGAGLSGIHLEDAKLWDAHLEEAVLIFAHLNRANLKNANLRNANLMQAFLVTTDLRGADLKSADLRGANLIGANLYQTHLEGADLTGADLKSADLSTARHLTQAQIDSATG